MSQVAVFCKLESPGNEIPLDCYARASSTDSIVQFVYTLPDVPSGVGIRCYQVMDGKRGEHIDGFTKFSTLVDGKNSVYLWIQMGESMVSHLVSADV